MTFNHKLIAGALGLLVLLIILFPSGQTAIDAPEQTVETAEAPVQAPAPAATNVMPSAYESNPFAPMQDQASDVASEAPTSNPAREMRAAEPARPAQLPPSVTTTVQSGSYMSLPIGCQRAADGSVGACKRTASGR